MTTIISSPPERQQWEAALRRANDVRMARSQLKCDVRTGRCTAADVLACPPDCAVTMTVFELLLAVPKVGPSAASKLLSRCALSPTKQLGDLTERQRLLLAGVLRGTGSRA